MHTAYTCHTPSHRHTKIKLSKIKAFKKERNMRVAAAPDFAWRQESVVLPLSSALIHSLHRRGQEARVFRT